MVSSSYTIRICELVYKIELAHVTISKTCKKHSHHRDDNLYPLGLVQGYSHSVYASGEMSSVMGYNPIVD